MADGIAAAGAGSHNQANTDVSAPPDYGALFPINLGPRLLLPAAMDALLVAVLMMPVALTHRLTAASGVHGTSCLEGTYLCTQATHNFVSSDGVQIAATLLLGAGVSSWASAFKRYSRQRGTAQEAVGSLTWHEAQHIFMAIGVTSVFLGVHAVSVLNGPKGVSTSDAAPVGVLLTAVMSAMAWYPTLKARAMYLVDTPEPTQAKTVARRKLVFALQKAGVLHRGHGSKHHQPTIAPQTQHTETLRLYVERFPKNHWSGRTALANLRQQGVFWALVAAPFLGVLAFWAAVVRGELHTTTDIGWSVATLGVLCGAWVIMWAVWFMRFFWLVGTQSRIETLFVVYLASTTVGLSCFVEASQRAHAADSQFALVVLYFVAGFAFCGPLLSAFFSLLESLVDRSVPHVWADDNVVTNHTAKVLRINQQTAHLYDLSTEGSLSHTMWRPVRKQKGCLACEFGGPVPVAPAGVSASSAPSASGAALCASSSAQVVQLPNDPAANLAGHRHRLDDDDDDDDVT